MTCSKRDELQYVPRCTCMQAVADDCRQAANEQHCVLPFDLLGAPKELEQAAAGAAAAFGSAGVDVLVHNAGARRGDQSRQPP
jgi:NAD(P)-dependent dehydrogenase (short-subunit alcohol dehydrogenase family)